MPTPVLDNPPANPSTATPSTFDTLADPFIAWFQTLVTEFNAALVWVAGQITAAAASAAAALASQNAAAGSATAAAASAGAAIWSNVTAYVIGNRAISGINFQPYVRKTNGNGGADPSANSADWQPIYTIGFNGTIKTANYTAVAGDQYMHDTTAGSFVATLPVAPNVGDPPIPFKDIYGTFATNYLRLDPGANKFRGAVQFFDLDQNYMSLDVVWTGATWGWDYK